MPGSAGSGGSTPGPKIVLQSAVTLFVDGSLNVTGISRTWEPASPSRTLASPGITRGHPRGWFTAPPGPWAQGSALADGATPMSNNAAPTDATRDQTWSPSSPGPPLQHRSDDATMLVPRSPDRSALAPTCYVTCSAVAPPAAKPRELAAQPRDLLADSRPMGDPGRFLACGDDSGCGAGDRNSVAVTVKRRPVRRNTAFA